MFKKMLLLAMALCLLAGCATTKPAAKAQVPVDNNPTTKKTEFHPLDILKPAYVQPTDLWGPNGILEIFKKINP
jgi:uncharacterized lipoprotein YmbA